MLKKNKYLHKFLLSILFLLVFISKSFCYGPLSTSMSYIQLNDSTYAIELILIHDCSYTLGIPSTMMYGATDDTIKRPTPWDSRTLYLISTNKIEYGIAGCNWDASCPIKRSIYRDTTILKPNKKDYYLSANAYYICCRSSTVNAFWGSNYIGRIPSKQYKNSLPVRVKELAAPVCMNRKTVYNAGYYDPDGDSLVFTMGKIYGNGFPQKTYDFNPGYSATYPFGYSSPAIIIDSATGEITMEPKKPGKYLIPMEIREYRIDPVSKQAVYLGMVTVEFTFSADFCTNREPEFIKDTLAYTRTIEVGDKFCMNILGKDTVRKSGRYDTLWLSARGASLGTLPGFKPPFATFSGDTGVKNVTGTFCWTPTCDHVTYSSPHIITFMLEDNNCNLVEQTYSIYVMPKIHTPVLECLDIKEANEVKLSWKKPPKDSSFFAYHIYRKKLPAETSFTKIAVIKDSSLTSWTDINALNAKDTFYQYFITSQNSCGVEMRGSDTLRTLLIKSKNLPTGNTEFSWNKLNEKYNDNFIISIDTGQGLQVFDTINSTNYIFPLCGRNLKMQVAVYNVKTACLSRSSVSGNYFILDTLPPSEPKVKYATVKDHITIELGFEKPSDYDVKSYNIYYKKNNASFQFLTRYFNADTGVITFQHTGINAGTDTFSYKIVAIGSCPENVSIASEIHTAMQLAGTPGNYSNSLSWSKYTGFDVKQYVVELLNGNNWIKLDSFDNTITSFVHDSIPCQQTQYYRIKAITEDSAATTITSLSDSIALTPFDTVKPSSPHIENVTILSSNTIKISWEKSASTDVKEYRVYRKEAASPNFILAGIVFNELSFTDTLKTDSGITFCYAVKAVDSCAKNESDYSNTQCMINLIAETKFCNRQLFLIWTTYKNAITYNIFRSKSGAIETLIASVPNTNLSFTDSFVNDSTVYCYRIEALDKDSNFISSSNISCNQIYKQLIPEIFSVSKTRTSATVGEVLLKWKSLTSFRFYSHYRIFYKKEGDTGFVLLQNNIPLSQDSFVHKNLNTKAEDHLYYITAVDSCGNKTKASPIHKTINLEADIVKLSHKLSWTHYKGWPVQQYVVERMSGSNFQQVTTVSATDTTVILNAPQCYDNLYYRIKAVSATAEFSYSDTIGVEAFDTIPPATSQLKRVTVTQTGATNGEALVEWISSTSSDVATYSLYKSEEQNTNWQLTAVNLPSNKLSYLDPGLNTLEKSYRYRLLATDSCGNTSTVFSDVQQTILLKAKSGNEMIELNWSSYEGWPVQQYEVYKDGSLLISLSGTDLSYTDTSVICPNIYIYKIKAISANDVAIASESNESAVAPFDNNAPDAPYLRKATVTVPNKEVLVQWNPSSSKDAKIYELYRTKYTNGGGQELIFTTNNLQQTFFTDTFSIIDNYYCYVVKAIDHCGNTSISSNEGCIMVAEGKAENLWNSLKWNSYSKWPSNVAFYNIYRKTDSISYTYIGSTKDASTVFTDRELYADSKEYCYKVEAIENGGFNEKALSTEVCLQQEPVIWIPNAFTPYASTDLNDYFSPKGMFIKNYEMQIINSWGEEVYNTDKGKPWDGKYRGSYVPDGVYLYMIKVNSLTKKQYFFKGTLTILR